MNNTWELDIQRGWILDLGGTALLLASAIACVVLAFVVPLSLWTFLLGSGAVLLLGTSMRVGYQLWGLVNAAYEMDRNAILIHWGDTHHQIPMQAVQGVISGAELTDLRLAFGLRWPGYRVGLGQAAEIGPVLFYATAPVAQQVIIRTTGMAYAISPTALPEFLQALRERLEMGPTQEVQEISTYESNPDSKPMFISCW